MPAHGSWAPDSQRSSRSVLVSGLMLRALHPTDRVRPLVQWLVLLKMLLAVVVVVVVGTLCEQDSRSLLHCCCCGDAQIHRASQSAAAAATNCHLANLLSKPAESWRVAVRARPPFAHSLQNGFLRVVALVRSMVYGFSHYRTHSSSNCYRRTCRNCRKWFD